MADPGAEFDQLVELQLEPQAASVDAGEPLGDVASEFDRLTQLQGQNAPPTEVSATPELSFDQRHSRRDEFGALIPIDKTSGMRGEGLGYWRISQQSDPEAKLQALQKLYPDRKSRILDSGDVALEVIDSKTGKPKDVMINPVGMDAHDLLDLASSAPEVAAGIAAAIATQGRGTLRTAAQIIASSLAGGATGFARDVGTRAVENIDVRPLDAFKNRAGQTVLDAGLQTGLGVVGKASRILSPFAREVKPGSLAFDLQSGQDFLKRNFDIDLVTTPGQRTGNQSLLAIEAAESPMPGARSVFNKVNERNTEALQGLQTRALGEVTSEERLGEEIIGTLRREQVEPIEKALMQARETALTKGDAKLQKLIDDAVGVDGVGRITPTQAGEATTQAFERRITRAQTTVDEAYAKVNALPGGTGDVLDGTAAADAAAEIRKELPSVLKTVEKPTGMLDASGQSLTREVEEKQLLRTGIPEGLEKALTDLESLRGGKVSLQTLTNMKKAAHDAIAAFRTAHGDVKDRWFSKIAVAYERGLQDGVRDAGDPALASALENARTVYKREMVPLERVGIKELAKDEFDPGHLSPEQVMDRLFEGPKAIKNYQMLQETLGPTNPAFKALKRAWADTQLAKASDPVSGTIDPDKLYNTLKTLDTERPELAREILGKNYQPILQNLRMRGAVERAGIKSLDESEVRLLLSLPDSGDLATVLKAVKSRDTAYVNTFLKDVADGVPLNDFQPTKLVRKLRNTDVPSGQVEEVLKALPKEQRQALATAELYRLLNEATTTVEGSTAAQRLAGGRGNVSATALVKAFGTGDKAKRTTLLLGEDLVAPGALPPKITPGGAAQATGASRVDVIENLVKVLAPKEAAQTAFHSLGGLRQGMAVAELMHGPLRYAGNFAKNMFMATAYTRGLGKVITNRAFDAEASAVAANTLIASEPFLRSATEAFGPDMAKSMVAEVKDAIDKYVMELSDSPRGRERAATQQFMQGGQVPMRMEAR
jgi:hypothetical protein